MKFVMAFFISFFFFSAVSNSVGQNNNAYQAQDTVVYDMSQAQHIDGFSYTVPVYFKCHGMRNAIDFSLKFNHDKLEFEDIIISNSNLYTTYFYDQNAQILRFTSHSLSTLISDSVLFSLRFRLKKLNTNINDLFNIKSYLNGLSCYSKVDFGICSGDSIRLSSSWEGNVQYLWSTGEISKEITVRDEGIYWVQSTLDNGTITYSEVKKIKVNPTPTIILSHTGEVAICNGESVKIEATLSDDVTFLWSNGAMGSSIVVNRETEAQLNVETKQGCKNQSEIVFIKILPVPSDSVIVPDKITFCPNDSVKLEAKHKINQQTYVWSNGKIGQQIYIKESGSYSFEIISHNGCKSKSNKVALEAVSIPSDINTDGYVDIRDFLNLVTNFNLNCPVCPTDINKDGKTDGHDFLKFITRYNSSCIMCQEDINKDNSVNTFDFLFLVGNYNTTCGDMSCKSDINKDGRTDNRDFLIFVSYFAYVCKY